MESAFAERLEAEREAVRRDAMERIAAAQKAGENPAVAAPEAPGDPNMLAMAADVLDSQLKPVPEPLARGLVPPTPRLGDKWVYLREIRDGEAVTRRNYLTMSVMKAGDSGYEVVSSASDIPYRFDASGNLLSQPAPVGHGVLVIEPSDSFFRYPLESGKSWSARTREVMPDIVKKSDNQVAVLGWEDVRVPAGGFHALKISKVTDYSFDPMPGRGADLTSRRVTTIWFVPALRTFARYETREVNSRGTVVLDQSWELDSFKLH
jgi:hypothetical protein